MPDHRVFVASLPRSGSSMMTAIVEQLGVHMVYTTEDAEELERREEAQRKRYGEHYRMNPHFYEISKNQFASWMEIYNTPFSGCKVIIPVGGMRWQAMISQPAKVVMMWRDPAEIRQSQEASYNRARADYSGDDDQEPWEHAEAHLRTLLAQAEIQFTKQAEQGDFAWIQVPYRRVLENPRGEIARVADFIGADLSNIPAAVKSVDPNLCRFKVEELEEGI